MMTCDESLIINGGQSVADNDPAGAVRRRFGWYHGMDSLAANSLSEAILPEAPVLIAKVGRCLSPTSPAARYSILWAANGEGMTRLAIRPSNFHKTSPCNETLRLRFSQETISSVRYSFSKPASSPGIAFQLGSDAIAVCPFWRQTMRSRMLQVVVGDKDLPVVDDWRSRLNLFHEVFLWFNCL